MRAEKSGDGVWLTKGHTSRKLAYKASRKSQQTVKMSRDPEVEEEGV